MQQQQKQENQQFYNPNPNENKEILQRLIYLLQNKQRKPKPQFEQKNDEDENNFDTILEQRENGSHLSLQQSMDTYQTFISINISDYEAQILKKILQDLLNNVLQISDYEKSQKKVHSDLQYQQISIINDPQQSSSSDIVQLKQEEESDGEQNTSTKKQMKKNEKILNEQDLLKSFRNFRQRFQRYFKELINYTNVELQSIRGKIQKKYLNYQIMMKAYKGFMEQIIEVMGETSQVIQEYDKLIQEKNHLFKK